MSFSEINSSEEPIGRNKSDFLFFIKPFLQSMD